MERRQVTHTTKDQDGDIIALCNPGMFWSPVSKSQAIRDIESNTHSYYVKSGIKEVYIHVVKKGDGSKYLRTDPDSTDKNNLDELPDC